MKSCIQGWGISLVNPLNQSPNTINRQSFIQDYKISAKLTYSENQVNKKSKNISHQTSETQLTRLMDEALAPPWERAMLESKKTERECVFSFKGS